MTSDPTAPALPACCASPRTSYPATTTATRSHRSPPPGLPYQYRWVDHDHGGDLVYAETADDLLDHWLPGYRDADPAGQALLRAQHAVQIRDALVAQLLVDAENNGITLTPEQEAILLADLDQMPDITTLGPTRPAGPARGHVPALHRPAPTPVRHRRRRPRPQQHHLAPQRPPRHLCPIPRRRRRHRPRHPQRLTAILRVHPSAVN